MLFGRELAAVFVLADDGAEGVLGLLTAWSSSLEMPGTIEVEDGGKSHLLPRLLHPRASIVSLRPARSDDVGVFRPFRRYGGKRPAGKGGLILFTVDTASGVSAVGTLTGEGIERVEVGGLGLGAENVRWFF
ncbi:MAG: hypothetical protein IPN19_12855 [Elusimicrobia bacterium]|nr:hypothetical protein [Elusimicrobiota bacterium]